MKVTLTGGFLFVGGAVMLAGGVLVVGIFSMAFGVIAMLGALMASDKKGDD